MPKLRNKRTVTILAVIIAAAAVLLAGTSTSRSAYLRGKFSAYRDVRGGRYVELSYGKTVIWLDQGMKLVHERHPDAEFRPVAGCIVTQSQADYVAGYNSYSIPAATHHFGRNIFDEAFNDAEDEYENAHPKIAD